MAFSRHASYTTDLYRQVPVWKVSFLCSKGYCNLHYNPTYMFTIRRLSSLLHPLSLYSNSPDVYKICPEGIHPRNLKNGDIYWRRHTVQESLDNNKDKASQSPASRHLGPSHSYPNSRPLPCHIFLNLFWVWNLFHFKRFQFGENPLSHREANQGWRGLSHLVDQMFSQKTLQ